MTLRVGTCLDVFRCLKIKIKYYQLAGEDFMFGKSTNEEIEIIRNLE